MNPSKLHFTYKPKANDFFSDKIIELRTSKMANAV